MNVAFNISDSLYSYEVYIHSQRQTSTEAAIHGKELGIQNKIPHDAQVKNIEYAKRQMSCVVLLNIYNSV